MSSSSENNCSAFIPLCLLSLALLLVLSWQVFLSLQIRSNARAQFEQRKQLVEQSTRVQGSLESIVNDLLKLAETDRDAKTVVDKYGIRRNTPAGEPAAK